MVTHKTVEVRFVLDKNGKRFAQKWSWVTGSWVKTSLKQAELMVASGAWEEAE